MQATVTREYFPENRQSLILWFLKDSKLASKVLVIRLSFNFVAINEL